MSEPQNYEPAIEIEAPATQILVTHDGKISYATRQTWVKLGVSFGRGPTSMLARLSGSEVKVFLAIALHINTDHLAWPSLDTIHEETNLHRDTLIEAIKILEKIGLIEVQRSPGRGNSYTVRGYAAYGMSEIPTSMEIPTTTSTENPTPPVGKIRPEEEPVKQNQEEEPISAPVGALEEVHEEETNLPQAETGNLGSYGAGLRDVRTPSSDGSRAKHPWRPPDDVYGRKPQGDTVSSGELTYGDDEPKRQVSECEIWLIKLTGTRGRFTDVQAAALARPYSWMVPNPITHAIQALDAPAPIELFKENSPRGDDFRDYVSRSGDKARNSAAQGRISRQTILSIVKGWRYADTSTATSGDSGEKYAAFLARIPT